MSKIPKRCPRCKKAELRETTIPISSWAGPMAPGTALYGIWLCDNCGWYRYEDDDE